MRLVLTRLWQALLAAWVGMTGPGLLADDWPAYRHDAARSAVTGEAPSLPLRLVWRYTCAQPPRPAWPDSFRMLNRMDFDYAPAPVIADGLLCFGSSADDTVRALDADTGVEKWHFITGGPVRFAPQMAHGKVYFGADDGFVYCLAASTGRLLWKFRAGPYDERLVANHRMISRWPMRTGALVVDSTVYVTAGMLPAEGTYSYALEADSGRVIWCNDTSGGTPQGALLANEKYLLVPNARQAPLILDRLTGQPAGLVRPAMPGAGGTWATLDRDQQYSFALHRSGVLYLLPMSLSDAVAARPWGAGAVPQITIEPSNRAGMLHERAKVSAIVHAGNPYIRKAFGIALAGRTLFLGQENSVVAERASPVKAAELRFGVAGEDLLVHASVSERQITQGTVPWKGSCVEVFGALPGKAAIGQVFLVPGTATEPARAWHAEGGQPVLAPAIRLHSTATKEGFELAALIPLALLALEPASPEFRLEAQVTVTGPDATFQRDTLFGSPSAYQDSQKYGTFRLKPQATKPNLQQLKAALARELPQTITLRAAGQLWQAPVSGEARELALANGRLFVATHLGEISCFAPADPGPPVPAIVHAPATALAPPASAPELPVISRLRQAGMDRGFALVLGDADGHLSLALAAGTQLQVINAMTDDHAAAALRERLLTQTAWYGTRLQVASVERLDRLPFAQYFANTVIVAGAVPQLTGAELYRVLRPCGGLLLLPGLAAAEQTRLFQETGAPSAELTDGPGDPYLVRGKLPGALDWDNRGKGQMDQLLKWPLRPLWLGGPTTQQAQNFGEDAMTGAVPANGRLFLLSEQALTAVDAYNGAILWTRPIPKKAPGLRLIHGVLYQATDPTPYDKLALGRYLRPADQTVQLELGPGYTRGQGKGWVRLDARTGEQLKVGLPYQPPTVHTLPSAAPWAMDPANPQAATVAMTSTADGLTLTLSTKDASISPLDAWDLYFDCRPPAARYGLYDRGSFHLRVVVAQNAAAAASWSPGNNQALPTVVVTGQRTAEGTLSTVHLPWTGLTELVGDRPTSCDFAVTLNAHDRVGEPLRRQHLFGDWAADGINNGWARIAFTDEAAKDAVTAPAVIEVPAPVLPATAKPAVVAKVAPAGPSFTPAPDLTSAPGSHPLTGEPVPKITGLAPVCGGTTIAANLIFGQSRIYDLTDNSGVRTLYGISGVKTGCSTPQTAALGLMILTEERGHCVCNYAFHTTVVAASAERRLHEDWAQFYDRDIDTLLRTALINLAAPGDRRDPAGDLWLNFPRADKPQRPEDHLNPDHALPYPLGMRDAQTGLWYRRPVRSALAVPLTVDCLPGLKPYRFNADRRPVAGTDRPWLYSSGTRGIQKAVLRLNFHQILSSAVTPTPLVMDGQLADAGWSDAWHPDGPVTLPYTGTRVRFRHDDQQLYIGAQRPPMNKWGRAPRVGSTAAFVSQPLPWQRGNTGQEAPPVDRLGQPLPAPAAVAPAVALSASDNWWRLILSDKHAQKALYLTVTPDGRRTMALYDEAKGQLDRTWSAPWTNGVTADEQGMSIESAIPWTTLAAAGLERESLAINCFMYDPGLGTEALTYLGIGGLDHCTNFTPLGLGQAPPVAERQFTVRLHFSEPDQAAPGQRVFDVKLQGQTVLKDFDIAREGGVNTALVKEFRQVPASSALTVEFVSHAATPTAQTAALLSALEVREEPPPAAR